VEDINKKYGPFANDLDELAKQVRDADYLVRSEDAEEEAALSGYSPKTVKAVHRAVMSEERLHSLLEQALGVESAEQFLSKFLDTLHFADFEYLEGSPDDEENRTLFRPDAPDPSRLTSKEGELLAREIEFISEKIKAEKPAETGQESEAMPAPIADNENAFTKEEYGRFAHIHKRLSSLVDGAESLSLEEREEFMEDVQSFWPTITRMARNTGVSLKWDIETVIGLIREPEIVAPDISSIGMVAACIGGDVAAIKAWDVEEKLCKYREKKKARDETIRAFDRIMLNLSETQKPDNKAYRKADGTDEWWQLSQAASSLSVSRGTVTRWADEGKIEDNGERGRKRKVLTSSVLRLKYKREHEDVLKDAADDLQDRANKIPDRH